MYYCNYNPHQNMREVVEYNGIARKAANGCFINAGAMHVANLFESEADALKSWGEYSTRPVKMPDGKDVIPIDYFHPKEATKSVFIPWDMVRGELWPHEAVSM